MFFRKNGFSLALIVSWILREQKTKTFLTSVKELYTLYAVPQLQERLCGAGKHDVSQEVDRE
jgi:hypothetical protein